jgi:hypothetical protein
MIDEIVSFSRLTFVFLAVWLDLCNSDDPIPIFNSKAILKVSRVSLSENQVVQTSATAQASSSQTASSNAMKKSASVSQPASIGSSSSSVPPSSSGAASARSQPLQQASAPAPAPAPSKKAETADVLGLFDDSSPSNGAASPSLSADIFSVPASASSASLQQQASGGMTVDPFSSAFAAQKPAPSVGNNRPASTAKQQGGGNGGAFEFNMF